MDPIADEALELLLCIQTFRSTLSLDEKFDCLRLIRRRLSGRLPPFDLVIREGLIPDLLTSLRDPHEFNYDIRYDSVWCLTNIASGSHANTRAVVDSGAVDTFVQLLAIAEGSEEHASYEMDDFFREQVFWAMGNICGDSAQLRDLCVEKGLHGYLRAEMQKQLNSLEPLVGSYTQTLLWATGNIFRHGDFARATEIQGSFMPHLKRFLDEHHESVDTVCNTIWAVYYMAQGGDHLIQGLLDSGLLRKVIAVLSHPHWTALSAALWALRLCAKSELMAVKIFTTIPAGLAELAPLINHNARKVADNAIGILLECSWAVKHTESADLARTMAASHVLECLWTSNKATVNCFKVLSRVIAKLSYEDLAKYVVCCPSFVPRVTDAIDEKESRERLQYAMGILQHVLDEEEGQGSVGEGPGRWAKAFADAGVEVRLRAVLDSGDQWFSNVNRAGVVLINYYTECY